MKTQKINFEGIKNSLSRTEMKKIMAGSGGGICASWYNSGDYGKCFNCCLAYAPGSYDYCSGLCSR